MADFINLDIAYDSDSLTVWYISSVGSETPVWTDKHIEELLNDFYLIPKDTPAADVTPVKHGHWISEYDCGYITPHCSECGETALTKEETSYDYVYSSYCPHCGAKMGGEVEWPRGKG